MARRMKPPLVDAHVHFWDIARSAVGWLPPDRPLLRRSFTPSDLRPALEATGIERAIIVQAAEAAWDNRWWLRLAERHPWIGAVIGWVDLAWGRPGRLPCARRGTPRARGGAGAGLAGSPGGAPRPRRSRARDLVLDLLIGPAHLPQVPRLAAAYLGLPLVVNHLARPPLATGDLAAWAAGMEALVPHAQIRCKVSGLPTAAGLTPTIERIGPVVQFALARFGAGRLIWGSDWPICLTAADYQTTHRMVVAALGPLSMAERAALFGGTAVRCYRLEEGDPSLERAWRAWGQQERDDGTPAETRSLSSPRDRATAAKTVRGRRLHPVARWRSPCGGGASSPSSMADNPHLIPVSRSSCR